MSSKNQKENRSDLENQDQVKIPENNVDYQTDQSKSLIGHLNVDDIIDGNGNIFGFLNRNRIDENLEKNPDHKVSCYYCCRTYLASKIENYTDGGNTIICPYCMVDSVLDREFRFEELKKMHKSMFSIIGSYVKTAEEIKAEEDKLIENLNKSIDELDLSVYSQNSFYNANMKYIGELVHKYEDDILKLLKFDTNELNELNVLLHELKLELGMKIDAWTNPNQKS